MVGDQPLFYIDDSADCEDLSFLDDFLAADEDFLSDDALIDSLRSKVEAYDRSAKSISPASHQTTTDVFAEFKKPSRDETLSIEKIIATATKSGTFNSYFNVLNKDDVKFEISHKIEAAVYNRDTKTILINAHQSIESAIHGLTKATRLAWQHRQGTLMNPLRFQPEDAIVVNRLIAADQDIAAVAVAWDLRLAGEVSLWNMMMNRADRDICTAYAIEAMTNFRSMNSGLAPRAAFEKWFISGRCKSHDREIIQLMLGRHADVLFNDEDISRMIAVDMIAKMGARPVGKNYLTPIVTNIMVDGLYTDVRDRANANFLWFIQFEKKMGDTEQKLQEDHLSQKGVFNTRTPHDKGSENAQLNIVTFPSPKRHDEQPPCENGIGASVYYIDHFRAF
jgi:hypothetical protein